MATDQGLSYDSLYLPLDISEPKIQHDLLFDKRQGATSVYVTANERDAEQGLKLTEVLSAGHQLGLRVFLDAYIGGTFSGDEGNSGAAYIKQHPNTEIVSRRGVRTGVPSVNDPDYRSYIKGYLATFLAYDFDGVLLDEPTMAVPSLQDQLTPGDYFPYDPISQANFRAQFGYDMPPAENPGVVAFRERSMQDFVADLLTFIKGTRPDMTTILVLVSHPATGTDFVGTGNWRAFAAMNHLDVLETDPYWYPDAPFWWFVDNVNSLISAVRPYGKRCGVWVQGFGMTDHYDSISRSLRYLQAHHVPWLAVWVTDHLPNADMAATWQQISSAYIPVSR